MTPDDILGAAGVAYNPPPAELITAVNGQISAALASLKPGSNGALVAIATQSGVNGAIVAKLPHGWSTVAWLGKTWSGPLEGGVAVKAEW